MAGWGNLAHLALTVGTKSAYGASQGSLKETKQQHPVQFSEVTWLMFLGFHTQSPFLFQACLNTCKHKLIYEQCRCYQGEYIEYYTDEEVDDAPNGVCDTVSGANQFTIVTRTVHCFQYSLKFHYIS